MFAEALTEFCNPASCYRGAPFWSWNGLLDPAELRRQIRLMHRMGLGGFFMHSRVGLATPYLSEEWMQCIDACVEEADNLGMRAWLYDEDRWPSGAAGGFVTRDPAYRETRLTITVYHHIPEIDWDENLLAVFQGEVDPPYAGNLRPVTRGSQPQQTNAAGSVITFSVTTRACHSWFNGYTYLDTLSHEAVQKFIDVTHEAYAERHGQYFGNVIPGMFTDEPQHAGKLDVHEDDAGNTVYIMPWTRRLPEIFRQRYGYDIIPHLPELAFDIDNREISPVRYQFHDCLAYLFTDAFARQIGEWCEQNDLQHTGHLMEEPTLISQNNKVTNCMRFYEYMQTPGMDLLTQYRREFDTAKQVSSVARQFGRRWRLSETYGCTGWDFPFLGHKALGDWQTALGINLRCQHLSWYTMEGQAKRDYPASIFFQSPWWPHYSKVENYFARINTLMSRGREVRDLLVIHPIESMWLMTRAGWKNEDRVKTYNGMLPRLRNTLLGANIDFDYGDEDIIARHAGINNDGDTPRLTVAQAPYRAVLLPPMLTVRKSTVDILEQFRQAGGHVIVCDHLPEAVDGDPEKTAGIDTDAWPVVPLDHPDQLVNRLTPHCRRITITDQQGNGRPEVLYQLREDEDAWYLFICNISRDCRQGDNDPHISERTTELPHLYISGFEDCDGHPIEMLPDNGEYRQTDAVRSNGQWEIRTSLHRLASALFAVPKTSGPADPQPPPAASLQVTRSERLEQRAWTYKRTEPNVLVLDKAAYRVENKNWEGPQEILRVDQAVRDHLGAAPRGGAMLQPWTWDRSAPAPAVEVELHYELTVETPPAAPLYLAVEHPERFRIRLNEHDISPDTDCGWWVDPSLRCLLLDPSHFKSGRNELRLDCAYDANFSGLETAYILGEFGVALEGTDVRMTALPAAIKLGDIGPQGLPFYSGNLTYTTRIQPDLKESEQLFLQLPRYEAVGVRILVNDREAGVIAWPPNELDLTPLVESGQPADLSVQILGHRRNSHGPLHLADQQPRSTSAHSFLSEGENWQEAYQTVQVGLMEAPCLAYKTGRK